MQTSSIYAKSTNAMVCLRNCEEEASKCMEEMDLDKVVRRSFSV